jgi:hypothetical protein
MAKKIYRTMLGKEVDMDALLLKNETIRAVSNIKINARGDELGPNGQIIRKREDSASEYYEDNPKSEANKK